jgi:F-type H+-transporting ATPase subunit delta
LKVNHKIARRYARALFKQKALPDIELVLDELKKLKSLLTVDSNVSAVFINPMFVLEDRRKALAVIIDRAGFSTVTSKFVLFVMEEGFLHCLGEIIIILTGLVFEARKKARVTVKSSDILDDKTVESLKKSLEARLEKQVEMTVEIEPSIIGGLVIRVGDIIIDASIKGQLNQFKEELIKG